MGKKIKRIFVSICIVTGIALLAVPFYYHFHGQNETDKLIEQFEKTLEDNEDETEKSKEEGKKQTSLSEEDAALRMWRFRRWRRNGMNCMSRHIRKVKRQYSHRQSH